MASNIHLEMASELRTVVTRMVKKLRKEGVTGQQLSLTERSTLALLQHHRELLPSELAAMEKITNQSMSQIIRHLMEMGFINRIASKKDGRKVIISLTEKGEEIILKIRYERDQWLAKAITATCTDAETALLKQVIDTLTKIVDFE